MKVDNSLILGQLSEGIMEFISIFFYLQTHQIKILEKHQLSDQEYKKFTREGEKDDGRLLSTFNGWIVIFKSSSNKSSFKRFPSFHGNFYFKL